MEAPALLLERPSKATLKEKSLAVFVLTNVFPVITRIFQYLTYNSLSNACQVCRLWKTFADNELTKRIPFAIRRIDKDIDENLQNNENFDHFGSFMNELMIRPDFVLRAVLLDKNEKILQTPDNLPHYTTFLSTSAPGVFGQLHKTSASFEYEVDEDVHSFLCLQYSEKFKFSFFRNDKTFGLISEDDLNNYCDRDISDYIDPFILVFLFPYSIVKKFLNVVRQTFLQRSFSVVGGIAFSLESLVNEKREDRSLDGKIAGLIFDGRNIEYEVLMQKSDGENQLLSAFQKMKENMMEKTKCDKLELKNCFMLMVSDENRNVACDNINKVFPGLPVFDVVSKCRLACYATNETLGIWNHTPVFCFIALKDERF